MPTSFGHIFNIPSFEQSLYSQGNSFQISENHIDSRFLFKLGTKKIRLYQWNLNIKLTVLHDGR